MMQLWKSRAELKAKGKQNKALVNMKWGGDKESAIMP